jgi:hypothetical protein
MKPKIVGDARERDDGKFFHTFKIDCGNEFRNQKTGRVEWHSLRNHLKS